MPIMDNHKSELLETVDTVSKFAGSLAGKVVVYSRGITDHLKDMMAAKLEPKPEPSTKATKSTKSPAKAKLAEIEEKKPAAKQPELKEDTEKPMPSSDSQGCPKPKANKKTSLTAKSQKRQPAVTRKTKSNVTPSGPTGKS